MHTHLRILRPHPNILAFYDGRVPGVRFADGPNWVDDGALSLGIASYALLDGDEALVYDTHVSLAHADCIRWTLEQHGARKLTVVLSHWHLDHVAGNAIFSDCDIIACAKTAAHLARRRTAIEAGTCEGPPCIAPLVMPTRTFEGRMTVMVGGLSVELIEFDIHSDDGVVLWLAQHQLLLAGDTLEDTVTYVAEPANLARHLPELDRLAALGAVRILPNHGCPDRIAQGGYGPALIPATARYVRALLAMKDDASLREKPLREIIAVDVASGALTYFCGYEAVHAGNVEKVAAGHF